MNSLKDLLQNMARDTEALLVQQARTATELQDGLMRTRMVPFHQHAPRLARLVRQTALEAGKRAELQMQGGGELDRQVLERMLGPFEHMLRNAVIHGIETPAEREAARKPAAGSIFINLRRDGSEAVVEIADDGRGLDVAAIRRKAAELGFVEPGTAISDEEAMQFILRPGFSTADRLTQAAGRGIGMDVVTSEVAKLGGSLRISSVARARHDVHDPPAVHARGHPGADRARGPRALCAAAADRGGRHPHLARPSSWPGSGPSSRPSSTAARATSSAISASTSVSASRASRTSRAACRSSWCGPGSIRPRSSPTRCRTAAKSS